MAASEAVIVRLFHIRDEVEGVAGLVHGLSYEDYQQSYMHRRAIERAVQIISEAAKALPRAALAGYQEVPWASIIGIGNILRHEYQRLDDHILWEIATVHLPVLEPVIKQMIADLEG